MYRSPSQEEFINNLGQIDENEIETNPDLKRMLTKMDSHYDSIKEHAGLDGIVEKIRKEDQENSYISMP